MIRSKILNIPQILGCVFVISALIFRSIQAGILILVPLVSTVFINFGIMGLFGIPLNIPTSLVSAMAIGIGADYAIYLSFRMREVCRHDLYTSIPLGVSCIGMRGNVRNEPGPAGRSAERDRRQRRRRFYVNKPREPGEV